MSAPVSKTMRAARLTEFNKPYELLEIPVPTIGPNDLLLKIGAAGFCHTDHQVYEGVYKTHLPITPSHEPVGTVVAVGEAAAKQGWTRGQRAGTLLFQHACGACHRCRTHRQPGEDKPDARFCERVEMAGLQHDGGFAEYMAADADAASPLPDGLPLEQAAPLMCAGATVWAGIAAARLRPGVPVAVVGVGGLGQLAVQFLKALGHPTVAIDNRVEGLELASEVGPEALRADAVVDFKADDAAEQVARFAGEGGAVAAVIVCTESVEATEWSLKLLQPHGVVVPLGLPVEGFHFNAFDIVFKELIVRGSLVATKGQVDEMLAVVDKHGIRSHVTTVGFEDVPRLPELYMDKHLKGRLVLKM
ncbi:Alcohol dehydrogenase superfamily zinc-containing [Neofusicoccum parvum]|uniref:Alcohol dehydrogenase superfamily zinc-containing n=1 Tax=Neofusicoccum parvum TaxID=310453 RepID=A0ACB5S7Z3_9PEZI|nr:Alcohol dehydrogenase superfamily zinc-containing [Neofusicoccum parvum]